MLLSITKNHSFYQPSCKVAATISLFYDLGQLKTWYSLKSGFVWLVLRIFG